MRTRMMHSSNVRRRVTKAAESADQVYELTDMDIEEVSMVDRAANKRKFLVVKGHPMGKEVRADGKGGLTATNKRNATRVLAAKDGALELPPGFKEAVSPMIDKATQALSDLSDQIDGSSVADVGDDGSMPAVPATVASSLQSVMTLLDQAQSMWPTAAPEADDGTDSADGTPGDGSMPDPTAMQMRLMMNTLEKLFVHKRLQKAMVAKVGAKMSKDRLTRLQQAVSALAALVNEVSGAPDPDAAAGTPGPEGAAKSKAAKSVAGVNASATDTKIDALAKAFESNFAKVIDVLKTHKADIDTLKGARNATAGAPVEGGGKITKAVQPHRWPIDMNNLHDDVKAETFFKD